MNYTIKDIVQNELCTGCGICISESLNAEMKYDRFGFLVPDINGDFKESAIHLCPFNPKPEVEVEDEDKLANIFLHEAANVDPNVGRYFDSYVGYSEKFRVNSSSGGVATYVFEQLLLRGIVDHIYIVKELGDTYAYQLFNDVRSVKSISKTKYIPVTLSQLFNDIDRLDGKVAVSGVGCFVKAVRLKQYYNPSLIQKIPFIVGIICGGLKSRFFSDYLAQVSGIEGLYFNQNYRIKDSKSTASDYSFGAYDDQNRFHQMKMSVVGDMWGTGLFKSNACDFCTDVTTELADISLGDAWLDPYKYDGLGTSVIVSRSKLAETIITEGIRQKELNVKKLGFKDFLLSQKGSFNHRHIGLKYRVDKVKKNGQLVPKIRERFLVACSIEFKLVQKRRMLLRKESLYIWEKFREKDLFDSKIERFKKDLSRYTVLYHRLGKIKKKLGINKL